MSERIKLKITDVKEPRTVGQAEVLDFFAQSGTETKSRYGVWRKSLYEYIKKDAVLDCEVEVKISEKLDPDGNPYVSRKVTQIFIDGQPVKQERQGGRQWGGQDEARTDARTAAMAIGDLWQAGKLNDNDLLVSQMYQWLSSVLPPVSQKTPPNAPGQPREAVKTKEDTIDLAEWKNAFESVGDSVKIAGWLSDLGYTVDKKVDKSYTDVVKRMNLEHRTQLATWIREYIDGRAQK